MSRKLRSWVKLDSKNVPVSGSNVNRPKRPVVGDWKEIETVDCCGPELVYAVAATLNTFTFALTCSASVKVTATFTSAALASRQAIADFLNNKLGFLGFFSVDGTNLVLKLKKIASTAFCADPVNLAFTAA